MQVSPAEGDLMDCSNADMNKGEEVAPEALARTCLRSVHGADCTVSCFFCSACLRLCWAAGQVEPPHPETDAADEGAESAGAAGPMRFQLHDEVHHIHVWCLSVV